MCALECTVFVCVLEEETEKESAQYSLSRWETPLQSVFVFVCKTEQVGGETGGEVKESDRDTVNV